MTETVDEFLNGRLPCSQLEVDLIARLRAAERDAARLRAAAERVVWFDWSGNDSDAERAIEGLRAALAGKQEEGR
jgi:hypothetical protein